MYIIRSRNVTEMLLQMPNRTGASVLGARRKEAWNRLKCDGRLLLTEEREQNCTDALYTKVLADLKKTSTMHALI